MKKYLPVLACLFALAFLAHFAGFVHAQDPRPEWNGYRVQAPGSAAIYLIDGGYRRHIADPFTYNSLFRNWDGVIVTPDLYFVPEAAEIKYPENLLVTAPDTPRVYLLDGGTKRWIASPTVMDQYWFSWDRLNWLPPGVLDLYPDGDTIYENPYRY